MKKIALLAAGKSKYFPPFIDKPKCLYHQGGEIQLEKAINSLMGIVNEEDIIVVGGYKYKYLTKFLNNVPKLN